MSATRRRAVIIKTSSAKRRSHQTLMADAGWDATTELP